MLQSKIPFNSYVFNSISNKAKTWSKCDWFAVLILFLLTLAYFYHVVIPINYDTLSDPNGDTRHQFLYWRYFGFHTLAKGSIPLWNPHTYSGTPFVAGMQSAIFYPLNLIFLILPTHVAINYSIILHIFLSGVFTYLYLRQLCFKNSTSLYGNECKFSRSSCLVSSIIFMFGAGQIFRVYAGHLTVLCAIIWLPLILLLLELFIQKRNFLYSIFCGIAVAFNLLAGHPQYFFYTAIAVVSYFAIRIIQEYREQRSWKCVEYHVLGIFIIYVIGVLLSAIQLLPAFEMIQHSARQTLSFEWVGQFSFAPVNFITLFIPEFFGDSLKVPYWGRYLIWEMSLYVGILPLIFCIIASLYYRNKFTKTFLILALTTAILALGKFTPLLKILYAFVPGFNIFRGNCKFMLIVAFSLSILSGIGMEYLQNGTINKKKGYLFLYISIGIAAVVCLCLLTFFIFKVGYGKWFTMINWIYSPNDQCVKLPNLKDPEFLHTTFNITVKGVAKFIVLLILSLLVIGLWFNGRLRRNIVIPITIALIFGDLWLFGNKYMITFDSQKCFWNKEMLNNILGNNPEQFRIIAAGIVGPNHGMANNISDIGGYDSNVVKEYSEFINLSVGRPIEEPNIVMEVTHISKLTNLLNLKYIFLPIEGRIEYHPAIKPIYKGSKFTILQNLQALPRAFIVHEVKTLQGRDAIFNELASKEFNPSKYIILEEPSRLLQGFDPENIQQEPIPAILEYSPNSVTIKANLLEDGYLVLGDTYYPGWNAYVDGRKSKVLKTDYVLRSVFLEKGDHMVKFIYEPRSFTIGMIITLSSMVILIPVILLMIRRC